MDTDYIRQQKKNLQTQVVAWSRGVIGDAEKPIVISGPSGVGKGTLINKLMKDFPTMFGFSVSHTTRAPREGEKNHVHYHFTERSVMEQEIKDEKFLEFASVHGNLYGTSTEAVDAVADAGKVYFFSLISMIVGPYKIKPCICAYLISWETSNMNMGNVNSRHKVHDTHVSTLFWDMKNPNHILGHIYLKWRI